MSKYTAIANALKQINDANFQTICDHFLVNKYGGDLSSPGTVVGKEKTKKGKPDAFLRLPDGNYILGEYTTQDSANKSSFLSKLEKDLKDCFELDKFSITKDQVNLIVLCCNSQVDIPEQEYLAGIASAAGFRLRISTIDNLSHFLYYSGKQLAKDLLSIPFDTGQVLDKKEFLRQYHRQNISTPLDNMVFGRDEQLVKLKDIIGAHDVIIIKGPAGAGKSRLALKAIDEFVKDFDSYKAYYIVQKNSSIFEDFSVHLESDKKYVLFIDDANRQIDNLLSSVHQVLEKTENNIKIVITVRDYAKEEVWEKCKALNPIIYPVENLSAEVIRQILTSEDFNIIDEKVVGRIIAISNGNPRLAIMAAKLYSGTPDMKLLQDVSSIYGKYFETYISDKSLFKNKDTLKVLGLLSFFYAMDMGSEDELKPLSTFNISRATFLEVIQTLEDLEMVEVYNKESAKISEQTLSTFFFYKVFLADKILDFGLLLSVYYQEYSHRMKDSIYPCESAFGRAKSIDAVSGKLTNYWKVVKDDVKAALCYLEVFGKYFPNQTFPFLLGQIENLSLEEEEKYRYEFFSRGYGSYDLSIRILEPFYESSDTAVLLTSIELATDYIARVHYTYATIIESLRRSLSISAEDILSDLSRQKAVFDRLEQRSLGNSIHKNVFYQLHVKTILGFHFVQDIYFRDEEDQLCIIPALRELRGRLWERITIDYECFPPILNRILIEYVDNMHYLQDIILEFDHPYITRLIETKISSNSFATCVFVQQYFEELAETGLPLDRPDLRERFLCRTYQIALVIGNGRFKGRNVYRIFGDFDRIENFKISEIKKNIRISTMEDFKNVYSCVEEILSYEHRNKFDLNPMVEQLLAGVMQENLSLGFKVLEFYLKNNNPGQIYPVFIYKPFFKKGTYWSRKLFSLITSLEFMHKETWLERYFDLIPIHLVTARVADNLIDFYTKRGPEIRVYKATFDKYENIYPGIYHKVLEITVNLFDGNKENKYELDHELFIRHPELLEQDLDLCKKTYLQQVEINNHYDNDGKELIVLFKKDNAVLNDFIKLLISFGDYSRFRYSKSLIKFWDEDGGKEGIYGALVQIINLSKHSLYDNIGYIFFLNLDKEHHTDAILVLKGLATEFQENRKAINLILDIVRNCLKPYYLDLIKHIVKTNPDMNLFKKMQWYNNHFSSNGEAIWADYKAAQLRQIYKAIRELEEPSKFILHVEELELLISREEAEGYRERKMRFMGLR